MLDLGRYKDLATTLQALITTVAVLVAGGWTYVLFIQNREQNPKASVEHSIEPVLLNEQFILLRTTLKVTNIGRTLLPVADVTVWVQQITPLADCGGDDRCPRTLIGAGKGVRAEGAATATWPLMDTWSGKIDAKLEPSETETLAFDFLIPVATQTIQIYSYLENQKNGRIGWKNHSIHTLR